MSRIQVFVPFTDTRDEMISHFNDQNVIRVTEPLIAESVERDSDFSVIEEVALSFAQDFFDRNSHELMIVQPDVFMSEFLIECDVIGFEVEIYAIELD